MLALAGACGRGRDVERAATRGTDSAVSSAGGAAGATSGASTAAGAEAAAGATGACPATGQWALCSITQRLERAGLAPRRDSGEIRLEPLTRPGVRLKVGSAELDLFLYPDAAARERDERRLDRRRFIDASEEPTMRREATLIRSANLLAVLRSINDRQRERVSDAIVAGPPQATAAPPPPDARSRK